MLNRVLACCVFAANSPSPSPGFKMSVSPDCWDHVVVGTTWSDLGHKKISTSFPPYVCLKFPLVPALSK